MPGAEGSGDADVDEVSEKLSEGLQSCRTVMEAYRLMLVPGQPGGDEGPGDSQAAENTSVADEPGNGGPL